MDPIVKKRLIIAAILFGLVVIVVVIFAVIQQVQQSSNSNQQPKTTTYTDPYSGETLTETEGKQGETYNSRGGAVFLGSSKLLEYGVPSNQLERLKSVVNKYSMKREAQKESKITEASVDVSTYRQFNGDGATTGVAFAIVFNRDSSLRYYVQILSTTISQFQIVITGTDQKTVVYDTNVDSFQE